MAAVAIMETGPGANFVSHGILQPQALADPQFVASLEGFSLRVLHGSIEWANDLSIQVLDEPGCTVHCDLLRRFFYIDAGGDCSAYVDRDQNTISLVSGSLGVCHGAARHFFESILTPRIWAEGECLVLHSALVARICNSVLLVGRSGRGKSTLAFSLAQDGWKFVGDDVTALALSNGGPRVESVVPGLRLLPDTREALMNRAEGTAIRPGASKQSMAVAAIDPKDATLTPSAIFVLEEPSIDGEVVATRVNPGDACMSLVANSFCLDPTDTEAAIKRMMIAAGIVASVPVFSLRYPRRYEALADVHREIDRCIRSICASAPASGPEAIEVRL